MKEKSKRKKVKHTKNIIKITCYCGTTFEAEVKPVIHCPNCTDTFHGFTKDS